MVASVLQEQHRKGDIMHELYELKEKLLKELSEYSQNGKFSKEDAEVIKYLSSSIDHLCNIVMDMEEDEGYSETGGRYRNSYNSYEGTGGGRGGNQGGGRGGSYARGGNRGRGRNARRDSMGRYSSEMGGYSRAEQDMDSMIEELREMMQELPQDKQREVQRFIQKIEQM